MAHLISFTTTRFDLSNEPPNPINPIAGQALLSWLRAELIKIGWHVTEPDAEDWGWFMISRKGDASYLLGASGEIVGDTPPTDWIVQIHKNSSLLEKLTGRNKLADDDLLTREIERLVRRDASIAKVEVETNA